MRSLPEKTMEHWTGLHLSSRFARAEQWWPTLGEDVRLTLRSTIASPGKLVMLEVKVPEVTAAAHSLRISVDQLQRYLKLRVPMFYVLPVPNAAAALRRCAITPPSTFLTWGIRCRQANRDIFYAGRRGCVVVVVRHTTGDAPWPPQITQLQFAGIAPSLHPGTSLTVILDHRLATTY
jgi:hypothetical protein